MTKETIEKLQGQIESVLSASVHPEDGNAIKTKLESLSTYLGTGAGCITESKRLMLIKRKEWLRAHVERIKDMSPSIVKEYVNTATVDEEILFTRCERNYSAITHSIEALRSLLSILKAEMSL